MEYIVDMPYMPEKIYDNMPRKVSYGLWYTLVFNTRYSGYVWEIYYWWYFLRGDVEESGVKWGMELLLEKVVMRQFKPTQFPNPISYKTIYVNYAEYAA